VIKKLLINVFFAGIIMIIICISGLMIAKAVEIAYGTSVILQKDINELERINKEIKELR